MKAISCILFRLFALALCGVRLIAIFLIAWVSVVDAADTSSGAPMEADSELLPEEPRALGTINGVKLSIPRYYLLPGLEYEGENFWEGKRRTFTPTLDSPLKYFAIELRLSTLEPIRTRQDVADHFKSGKTVHPYIKETWVDIGVEKGPVGPDLLLPVKKGWNKDFSEGLNPWGPFTRLPELEFGLAHSVPPHPVNDCPLEQASRCQGWGYDYYFDESSNATFISCKTQKRYVYPYDIRTDCNHRFLVPELNSFADASYTKKDIHRWREIEEKFRSIVHSFIVK